jgi:regulator of protease activity HflC (stomatin/prohibitin superfamily)
MLPFFIVRQQEAAIVESLGRYVRVAQAGFQIKMPWERVAGRLSLRIMELQVNVETKTDDDVFVRVLIAVQYHVITSQVADAFYRLSNPVTQIESYVFDVVRATVPRMKLDEVFKEKEVIADAVKEGLTEIMTQYGYGIVRALVNDIDPDAKVKAAMNEINAAQRYRKAAEERGEAERILKVKSAEGDAESKILQGKGIAGQRKAIVEGLRESVEEFQKGIPGATSNDVMQLVLMTQYFDTLKDIGANNRASTIMLPHTPDSIASLSQQLRQAITVGNVISDTHSHMSQNLPPRDESPEDAGHRRRSHRREDPEQERPPLTPPPGQD